MIYYARKKVCLEQFQAAETPSFVELPVPEKKMVCAEPATETNLTGFLLMYKRLDNGVFRWPRFADEALAIMEEQYRMLMQGLEIVARHPIAELKEPPSVM